MSEQAPILQEPEQSDVSLGEKTVADTHRERARVANQDAQETAGRVFINGQPATKRVADEERAYRLANGHPSDS